MNIFEDNVTTITRETKSNKKVKIKKIDQEIIRKSVNDFWLLPAQMLLSERNGQDVFAESCHTMLSKISNSKNISIHQLGSLLAFTESIFNSINDDVELEIGEIKICEEFVTLQNIGNKYIYKIYIESDDCLEVLTFSGDSNIPSAA